MVRPAAETAGDCVHEDSDGVSLLDEQRKL